MMRLTTIPVGDALVLRLPSGMRHGAATYSLRLEGKRGTGTCFMYAAQANLVYKRTIQTIQTIRHRRKKMGLRPFDGEAPRYCITSETG